MDSKFHPRRVFSLAVIIFLTAFSGCGRYLPPLPPESFSPRSVNNLTVTADTSAVNFAWHAPEVDQRDKDLRSMDGYRIYRKLVQEKSDLIDPNVPFEIITSISDTHIEELQKLRETAKNEGKISRKVKVDDTLKNFSFSDHDVQPGQVYAYRIIPFNQGSVEGEFNKVVKVLYRGTSSEIVLLDESKIAEEEVE